MKHTLLGAAIVICLAAGPAAAAPGDPFGGSETGCVPSGKPGLTCGKALTSAFGKLMAGVIKCHVAQASQAFKSGSSSPDFDTQEESCSVVGPKSAKAKFEASLAKAASACPVGIVPVAEARRDSLLGDGMSLGLLDSLNFAFFCDNSTFLSIADPGGGDDDELGFIPSTKDHYKCSVGVAKAFSKLASSVYKCHAKAAQAIFAGKAFDTSACEGPAIKGARAKYEAAVNKLSAAGVCPPCITDSMNPAYAIGLGASVVDALDAQNEEIYPCPAP